ncbi:MAG: STAS domain-containing protein [Candidatus Kapabacteria bacterium]|nr:STAS domain-containing protein [Candidatus Kapabacteria bacterium]
MTQVKVEEKEKHKIISLFGQFMGSVEVDLLRQALTLHGDEKYLAVILDFKELDYLNSSSLGALIAAYNNLKEFNVKLLICNLNKNVQNLFDMTKVALVLDTFNSLEEAESMIFNNKNF